MSHMQNFTLCLGVFSLPVFVKPSLYILQSDVCFLSFIFMLFVFVLEKKIVPNVLYFPRI